MGSVYPLHNSRASHTHTTNPQSTVPLLGEGGTNEGRHRGHAAEPSHRGDHAQRAVLRVLHSPRTQGRGSETRDKSEQISARGALQDGRHPCLERPSKSRRMDGKGKHKGCIVYVFTKTPKPVAALLGQLGVGMIIYIDNILILAESEDLAWDHAIGLVYLLENLGFGVSKTKCQLEPTQTIKFLSFSANSLKRAEPPQREGKKDPNQHTGRAREQSYLLEST